MWTVIISTLILSTMVIGLGIKLLTILNFLEKPNTIVWQLITVVVFCHQYIANYLSLN
ncbi:hypothetical protein ACG92U_09150 [Leuconostoc citreum]